MVANELLVQALEAYIDERNMKLKEIQDLDVNIATLTTLIRGGAKPEVNPEPETPKPERARRKRSSNPRRYKTSWDYVPGHTSEVGRRLRALMGDGKARTFGQIQSELNVQPGSHESKTIRNVLSYLTQQHLLTRPTDDTYRRAHMRKTNGEQSGGPLPSRTSQILNVSSPGEELTGSTVLQKLRTEEHLRDPYATDQQKVSRISAQLANMAADGILVRVREGVYTLR